FRRQLCKHFVRQLEIDAASASHVACNAGEHVGLASLFSVLADEWRNAVNQRQRANVFTPSFQLLRDFQSDNATERIADQMIWTSGLDHRDGLEIAGGHFLERD